MAEFRVSWLRVSRSLDAASLGHGGGHARQTRAVRLENSVARAGVDPAFRARLLANGRAACEELGITFYDDTRLLVLENTDTVQHLIVCTLCSGYPRPVRGLPPDWGKLKPYRARAVQEPSVLLAEFGTVIPAHVAIHVSDSTARVRSLVLPQRPEGTEHLSEEQLASLVTRDAMIGVVKATIRETKETAP
jgi:Nitrile hydratase, alpha chain